VGIEIRTNVPQAELREWRESLGSPRKKGWRRDVLATTVTTGLEEAERSETDPNTGYLTKPVQIGTKRAATAVRDAITDRRLASASRLASQNPAEWKALIENLRLAHPDLTGSLTDMEIYKTVVQRTSRDAAERTYKRIGRGGQTPGSTI
jgi:hypothetical protein